MEKSAEKTLTELNNGFMIFLKEWDDIKKNGFRFCATNTNEIGNMSQDIDDLRRQYDILDNKKAAKWTERALLAIMILILSAGIVTFLGGQNNEKASIETGGHILDLKPHGIAESY